MNYRPLGRSGIQVSAICLGTAFRGKPAEANCHAIIHRAIDAGINFIDCANEYQNGLSETILGKALKGKRDKVVLTSKVSSPVGTGPNQRGLSRRHILEQIDRSLQRLKTDRLDIYYAHEPDPDTPLEETAAAFDDVVRQGKARAIGFSNFPAWQVCQVLWICRRQAITPPTCIQNHYNLLDRRCELDSFPLCQSHGIAPLAYSAVAAGYLAGRNPSQHPQPQAVLATLTTLQAIACELAATPAQVAIAWLLHHPLVRSTLIGPDCTHHLEDALAATRITLLPHHLERLDQASAFWLENGEISR